MIGLVSNRVLRRSMAAWTMLALAVLVGSAVSGCGGKGPASALPEGNVIEVSGGSFTDIMPETLAQMLKQKNFLLVNVHVPYAGEIEGTDLFIPYNEIEQKLSLLPDKRQRIVVYCRSGHMSGLAVRALVKLGYADIWHLRGGLAQWQQDGFEIVQLPR